ncbi:Spermidine N(1)-acetyltransferase [Cytospora mali]|uniref:Spermidine N(1)-acetyltransferase n=1 Tax=Cytospora mali TaxID=578113 RepID=A0A194W035_CYTMA|nr:Spermidine N(1)-acetyltransferase [Valsa mali]
MAREQARPGRLPFDHLFRSKRLVFRALENSPEHTAFIRDVMLDDPETYAQSTNRLLVPLTVDDVEHDVAGLAKSLLAVVICLIPGKDAEEESDDENEHDPEPGSTQHGLTAIGWLTLDGHTLTRHHRSCTLGIMIASAHQGEGYGTEAINWALDWAFRVAGMHAVRLSCFSFNDRAVKLYQRLGFVREGVTREAYYFDGVWYNRILFSMLDREWDTIRGISRE